MNLRIGLAAIIKLFGFLLGGVAALVGAGVLYLQLSFDGEALAQALSAQAREQYHRSLRLEGTPSLQFWPRLALRLPAARLSAPNAPERSVVSMQALEAELALRPLLLQQIEITRVSVQGLALELGRDREGRWSLADLLQPAATAPYRLSLRELSLQLQSLQLRDAVAARVLILSEGRLQAQLGAADGRLQLTGRLKEDSLPLAGHVHLSSAYRLDAAQGLQLLQPQLNFRGQLARLAGGELQLTAQRLGRTPHWQAEALSVGLRGSIGPRGLSLSAQAPQLSWRDATPEGQGWQARLDWRAPHEHGELRAALTRARSDADGLDIEGFSVHAKAERGDHGLHAELAGPLRWQRGRWSAPAVSGELLLLHPRLQGARAQLSGALAWGAADAPAEGRLDLALGQAQLNAQARLERLVPASGRLDLAVEQLDLDALLKPAAGDTAPLRADWLHEARLAGDLRVNALRAAGLRIDSAAGAWRTAEGRLVVEPLRLQAYDGSASGQLIVNTVSMRYAAALSARGVDIGALLRDATGSARLSGTAEASLTLAGQGEAAGFAWPALLRSSVGRGRLSLREGSVAVFDLARSLRDFGPALAARRNAARTPGNRESTALARAEAGFSLAGGTLRIAPLTAANGWMRASGNGEYDLQSGELDLQLTPVVSASNTGSALDALRGRPLPLRLKGPLARPDVRLEAAPTAVAARPRPRPVSNPRPPAAPPTQAPTSGAALAAP